MVTDSTGDDRPYGETRVDADGSGPTPRDDYAPTPAEKCGRDEETKVGSKRETIGVNRNAAAQRKGYESQKGWGLGGRPPGLPYDLDRAPNCAPILSLTLDSVLTDLMTDALSGLKSLKNGNLQGNEFLPASPNRQTRQAAGLERSG